MSIKEYIAKARESGIFVGDRVQITQKAEHGENGWGKYWTYGMNETIGKIGQVTHIDNAGDYHVKFDNHDAYPYYPYFVLRLVGRMPIVPRFSPGDRVLIQRDWKEGENGTTMYFVKEAMSDTIGKIGEIVAIYLGDNNEFIYGVLFEDDATWNYPEFVLKKSYKPNPDFEFEPFDTLLHITGPTLSR